jgi:hypothetical protein
MAGPWVALVVRNGIRKSLYGGLIFSVDSDYFAEQSLNLQVKLNADMIIEMKTTVSLFFSEWLTTVIYKLKVRVFHNECNHVTHWPPIHHGLSHLQT